MRLLLVALALLAPACGSARPQPELPPLVPATAKTTLPTPEDILGLRPEGIGLPVGATVPDATAVDDAGRPVRLQDLVTGGPKLFVFYRGGWCPYCSHQVRSFAARAEAFQGLGVTPVFISVDGPRGAASVRAGWQVPFPVLGDPDLAVHRGFAVAVHLDEAALAQYREWQLDLASWSGRDDGTIAVPSMFLADSQGRILWSHADLDYKVRPTIDQVLRVIESAL